MSQTLDVVMELQVSGSSFIGNGAQVQGGALMLTAMDRQVCFAGQTLRLCGAIYTISSSRPAFDMSLSS